MAGKDHRLITKRSRDNVAKIGILLPLILFVVLCAPAFSEYRISMQEGSVVTKNYWIYKDKLHVFEDAEPIELYSVTDVKSESITPLEKQMHDDARRRWKRYTAWLVDLEYEISQLCRENLSAMADLTELRSAGVSRGDLRRAVKSFYKELDDLEEKTGMLRDSWDHARIPDISFVISRDIKNLQLLCMDSSIRQRRRFVKKWDPTFKEYAIEHARQARQFEESFMESFHTH